MKTILSTLVILLASRFAIAGSWEIVPAKNAGPMANGLNSISAASDNDIWAVGQAHNTPTTYNTVIEHWNGRRWSLVKSPNPTQQYNLLHGVAVVASNDVWAVGGGGGNPYQTLIEHWNGKNWQLVPSPNVSASSNVLQAVRPIAANDIWAVGYSVDQNLINHALTEHWDGTSWSIVSTPPIQDAILFGVEVVNSSDVWAVGSFFGNERTLALHWNGTSWTQFATPNPGSDDNVLYSVATIASNDVWAVGLTGSQALALHWNGTLWSVVATPQFFYPYSNAAFAGVVARSSTDVSVAGLYLYGSSVQETLAEHWDGTSWSVLSTPDRPNSDNRLESLALTPTGALWSAGVTGVFGKAEKNLILQKTP
jgi:hypothetical protein